MTWDEKQGEKQEHVTEAENPVRRHSIIGKWNIFAVRKGSERSSGREPGGVCTDCRMLEAGRRTRRDRSLIGDLGSGGLRSIFIFDTVNLQSESLTKRGEREKGEQFRAFFCEDLKREEEEEEEVKTEERMGSDFQFGGNNGGGLSSNGH